MKIRHGLALGLCLALQSSAFADFQYSETTKVTGGSMVDMAKFASRFSKGSKPITDPTTSSIYVKGNRMARVNDQNTEIIDLDAETITRIDPAKKEYTVTTFQELKEEMQAAMQKAQQQQSQMPQQPAGNIPADVKFKVAVNNTGATKDVVGMSASESILKMTAIVTDQQSQKSGTFGITNDMWMVADIPGYQEVRDFNKRMAEKMGDMFSGSVPPAMMRPGMGTSMSDMRDEMSKIKGTPVSQVIRMGSTMDGTAVPAASEAPLPQSNTPSAGNAAGQAAGQAANNAANSAANTATSNAESAAGSHMGSFGGVASSLGGFGGFHKKKPDQQQQQQAQAAPPNWVVLMETTIETTNLSSAAVDPSKFAVPAGYTKVLSEAQKNLQQKN
ncbi:MAG TPA: hypothetical protein VF753_21390 [Terriglobales bacterium]